MGMIMINTIVTDVVEDYNEDDEFGDCAVTPQMLREKAGIEDLDIEDDEFGDCAVTPQMLREKANVENNEDDEFGECAVTPQMLLEKINDKPTKKSKKKTKKNTKTTLPKLFAPLPVNTLTGKKCFLLKMLKKVIIFIFPTEKIPNFGQILRK